MGEFIFEENTENGYDSNGHPDDIFICYDIVESG